MYAEVIRFNMENVTLCIMSTLRKQTFNSSGSLVVQGRASFSVAGWFGSSVTRFWACAESYVKRALLCASWL